MNLPLWWAAAVGCEIYIAFTSLFSFQWDPRKEMWHLHSESRGAEQLQGKNHIHLLQQTLSVTHKPKHRASYFQQWLNEAQHLL